MIFERTIQQFGKQPFQAIQKKTVLCVGLGGVGGHAVEALVRSGIQKIILVDHDVVHSSNINRQIIALNSTINQPKVDVMKKRLLDINPDCEITIYNLPFNIETKDTIFSHSIDFVCDCIDSLKDKADLIETSIMLNIPIISSMGAGNKRHPELLEITSLNQTSYCPLARSLRKRLRNKNASLTIPVVYSKESPNQADKRATYPTSNSFVPATAGLLMASYIINNILETASVTTT